jgi:spermidine synthase
VSAERGAGHGHGDDGAGGARHRAPLLLLAAAVGALCGIVYELLLASLASYLLGSPVLVFSLTVGVFLASMGLGAFLSRFVHRGLLPTFLWLELTLSLFGGLLPIALFAVYAVDGPYLGAHVLGTAAVGALVGVELPLLTRMLEQAGGLRVAIARALALDYVGALVGSVLFPLVLLPVLGLVGSAAAAGAAGAITVAAVGWGHRGLLPRSRTLVGASVAVACALVAGAVPLGAAADRLESRLYAAPVIARVQSRHQRIVLTRHRGDVRMYLDGDLQWSALDEHRYHEALVHPALALHERPARVLVLGAGDGLAIREILKDARVAEIVLVELDEAVLELSRRHPAVRRQNGGSLDDPRVVRVVADAFTAIRDGAPPLDRPFDVVVADFPDPDVEAVARLYSTVFFRWVAGRLAPGGLFVTQASSPFFAKDAFFCIARTLEAAGFGVRPYQVDVPSFGPWGFHLAAVGAKPPPPDRLRLRAPTRFLTDAVARNLFDLPGDLAPRPDLRPNRLLDPALVEYQRDPRWAEYF